MNSDALSTQLRIVEDHLTEAAGAEHADGERVAIERGMNVAERLLVSHPDRYQAYHALGVLWYHHPDKTPERAAKMQQLLGRALELNPDSQFTIQYLAYLHFDRGDYRTALGYYERTDRKFFEREDQVWRWLKARESSIACRIHLDPASLAIEEIQAFISAYREVEARDESPKMQTELWGALKSLSPEWSARHAEAVTLVREFIRATGNGFILER